MKVKQIYPGLYLYTFPNQFELCHTFFRLQEFYESPIRKIRGKYFTYEDAITYYAYDQKEQPGFTYFEDWAGFNIPGNVVNEFWKKFGNDLTSKEYGVFDKLLDEKGNSFYLIGCEENDQNDCMRHEIAHGFYYLNKVYKKEMNKLIKEVPKRIKDRIRKELLSMGYCKAVIKDETHAYLSTGLRNNMVAWYDRILYLGLITQFEKTFKKYYKEIKK